MSSSSTSNLPLGSPGRLTRRRVTSMVVVEFSAAWPRWLKPNHFADATVIAQDHSENPIELIAAVARRAAHLDAIDCTLGSIVVVSNGVTAVSQSAARHSLVRGLLARLGALGGGKLVLTVDAGAGRRAERDLDVLARSFERSARRHGVELSVRVANPERDSLSAELLTHFAQAG